MVAAAVMSYCCAAVSLAASVVKDGEWWVLQVAGVAGGCPMEVGWRPIVGGVDGGVFDDNLVFRWWKLNRVCMGIDIVVNLYCIVI
ncbi:hypothetical protein Dimus_033634 [Dionaea muscipula]